MKKLFLLVAILLFNSLYSAEHKEMAEVGFPTVINANNSDQSGYDFIGLQESDPITMETFADMIDEKHKLDMPFVIARVLSLDNDGNKIYKYYPVDSINEHVYGPKFTGGIEFGRRGEHFLPTGKLDENQNVSRFKIVPGGDRVGSQAILDPLTKGTITGEIRYYAAYGQSKEPNLSFDYIGSDKDLTDMMPSAKGMLDFYKRIRLARFFALYNMEKLTNQDKADLLFLLGRIYQFNVYNIVQASKYYNLAVDFMGQEKNGIKKVTDCVGHLEKDCASLDVASIKSELENLSLMISQIKPTVKLTVSKKAAEKLAKVPKSIKSISNPKDEKMGFDYIDLNSVIYGTSKTFAQELDDRYKQKVPFVIARVVSMLPDETLAYSYYPISVIHKFIYGNPCFTGARIFDRDMSNDHIVPKPGAVKEDILSRFSAVSGAGNRIGAKSVYDPITGGFIALPINYYVTFGTSTTPNLTFNYIGSDKDLTEAQVTDFEGFPKKLRLARFFYLDCQASNKNNLKEDIADMLFLLGQIYQFNVNNMQEAIVYYNLVRDYLKKNNSIKNIINSIFSQREGNTADSYAVLSVPEVDKILGEFKKESVKQALSKYLKDFPNVISNPREVRNYRTALQVAAANGDFAAIEALVSIGADLEKENKEGQTPIMLYRKDGKLIDMLLLNDMNLSEDTIKKIVNAKDDKGKSVLQYIKENFPNDKEIVENLINLGAEDKTPMSTSSEAGEEWGELQSDW